MLDEIAGTDFVLVRPPMERVGRAPNGGTGRRYGESL